MIQSLPALRRQFYAENRALHELAHDDPRNVQPLSLEQLKKQAKDLLGSDRDHAYLLLDNLDEKGILNCDIIIEEKEKVKTINVYTLKRFYEKTEEKT